MAKVINKTFIHYYLDWIFNASNEQMEQALPGFAALISFAKDNQIIDLYTTKKDGELGEKVKRFEVSPDSVNYLEIK